MIPVVENLWEKRIKILHLSDLRIEERNLNWERVLSLKAILDKSVIDRFADGFDYVVVSGNTLAGPGASEAPTERRFQRVRGLLERLLKTYVEKRPIKADDESQQRLMIVPGPGDPEGLVPRAATDFPDIRALEDLTLVGSQYWAGETDRLESWLGELEKATSELENQPLEYVRNTPTLLVTSEAWIVDGEMNEAIARKLREALKKLRVSLHLFGKGPATCQGPDPFGSPHVGLGTGPPGSHRSLPPLRVNSLTFQMKGGRPYQCQDYSNLHSAAIDTLTWFEEQRKWKNDPYIKDELNGFFCTSISRRTRTPTHADIFRQVADEAKNGRRNFCVQGLPGSGRRAFWADLEECGMKGFEKIKKVELDGKNEAAFAEQLTRLRFIVDAVINDNPRPGMLFAVFDSGMRHGGIKGDGWTSLRRELLELFTVLLTNTDAVQILYLMGRIEDKPLKRSYDRDIGWEYKYLMPSAGALEDSKLFDRYARIAPLDVAHLREWTGDFVGFVEMLTLTIVGRFKRRLYVSGHQKVSSQLARELLNQAMLESAVLDKVREFFSSFGNDNAKVLHIVAEQLRILADLHLHGEDSPQGVRDWRRYLDDHMSRRRLRTVLRRLEAYGVLENNHGEYTMRERAPRVPFLLACRLEQFIRPQRVFLVYLVPYRNLAIELKKWMGEVALSQGFGIHSTLISSDPEGGPALTEIFDADLENEVLIPIFDDSPAAEILDAEIGAWKARPTLAERFLISVALGNVSRDLPALETVALVEAPEPVGAEEVARQLVDLLSNVFDGRGQPHV